MATPRVFISSTCYDLKYVRENLRYFVRSIGYDPVLSEDGNVFYNPTQHTHDACLTEIPTTQLFVLIIGGRYGGRYQQTQSSITNVEYREALRLGIPVFALVEQSVYNEHHLYQRNKANPNIDLAKIEFPASDSLYIFEFIDEVRANAVNNAIVPFKDFGDIEAYLRQQWAGMMFDFLTRANETRRVADMLSALRDMNARVEMLSEQILASVGTEDAKLDAILNEEVLSSDVGRDLVFLHLKVTPAMIILSPSFRHCLEANGLHLTLNKTGTSLSYYTNNTEMGIPRFQALTKNFRALRQSLIKILQSFSMTPEQYLLKRGRNEVVPPDDNDDSIPEDLLPTGGMKDNGASTPHDSR